MAIKFLEVLEKSNMNMKQFSDFFEIPYRTVQNWKSGSSNCPDWAIKLMQFRLESEKGDDNMNTRYSLIKNTGEFREWELKEGCTTEQTWQEPETLKSFSNKKEALEALKGYSTSVEEFKTPFGRMFAVTEFYVEEGKFDEDGEFVEGGDILDFSEMPDLTRYYIISYGERSAKTYTFDELKAYFKPSAEWEEDVDNYDELVEMWEAIEDMYDLKRYLEFEEDGMQVPYVFEEA